MNTSDRKKGKIILAIAFVIIASILVAAFLQSRITPPDKINGCLKDVSEKTVVLIDYSEKVTQQTKKEIVERARELIESEERVPVGSLVSVFTMSYQSRENLVPIFSHCKPKFYANPIIEMEKIIAGKYKDSFGDPLSEALNHAIPESNESPIAQAIIDLSLSNYLREAKKANLMIFSDMIENTREYSMYKIHADDQCIREYKVSREGRQEVPHFQNVAVEIGLIPRSGFNGAQLKCRDKFWNWFFRDNNGGSLNPVDLPG